MAMMRGKWIVYRNLAGKRPFGRLKKSFGLCGAFDPATRDSDPDVQLDNICNAVATCIYLFTVYLMMLSITLTVQN
jgi:hypothetical protein